MTTSPEAATAAPRLSTSDARIAELLAIVNEIVDLQGLAALAGWDQNTTMPDGAAEARGAQQATLQETIHDRWADQPLSRALERAEATVGQPDFTDADRGLAREVRREHDIATKLPRGLVGELARVESASYDCWRHARAHDDFAAFAPWLGRTIALQREVADRLSTGASRYDALLDQFEPGMTTAKLNALFGPIRATALALQRRIGASGATVDVSCLRGDFAEAKQMTICDTVLRHIGYDFERGQLAQSPHPFTSGMGTPFDVRLTVNPQRHEIQAAIMAAIHEGGHALLEQGVAPALARTPLATNIAMGPHESQSRLWENAIGRSPAFWRGAFAPLRDAFPRHFHDVDVETFARALNAVAPSLIRIEADEVTYNLHIMVRFELEQAMVNGEVAVESLPGRWNALYRDYLGIEPPNDREGILQDVHWSSGFGYFPSYTLGNLYAAQINATLRRIFPDLDARLAAGDTRFIRDWLRARMYQFGATYNPEALIERVTGEPPDAAYLARYLTEKVEWTYGLAPEGAPSA